MTHDTHVIFRALAAKHGGRMMITITEAAPALGLHPKTAKNRVALNTFPLPLVRDGGRTRVRLLDLARYLAGAAEVGRGQA